MPCSSGSASDQDGYGPSTSLDSNMDGRKLWQRSGAKQILEYKKKIGNIAKCKLYVFREILLQMRTFNWQFNFWLFYSF